MAQTITASDGAPIDVQEGARGAVTLLTFTLRRTGGTTGAVNIAGAVDLGTTDADDFDGAAPGAFNATILAGQTFVTVTLRIRGDFTPEATETLTLTITSAVNTLGEPTTIDPALATATGRILNDDRGTYGNDTIVGTAGVDVIDGLSGIDVISGLGGNDTLFGGRDGDTLNGGADDDLLRGDDGNDTVNGDAGNDRLFGGDGNDTLDGGTGNDDLNGGEGNDTVNGGEGNDRLSGAQGDDIVDGGLGVDAMTDRLGVNQLRGGEGDDFVVGAGVLDGGNGDDKLTAESPVNAPATLIGGAGSDLLFGGAGADRLTGGAGKDYLTGGAGADRFVFGEGDSPAATADIVRDFQLGIDKLDLAGIDANTLVSGDQAFVFIDGAAFSGVAGQLRISPAGAGMTLLRGDTNGDGLADFALVFKNGVILDDGDFFAL